jgi:hypothetical protein
MKPIMLPVNQEMAMLDSNPYSIDKAPDQFNAWNTIYVWGWIRDKFYRANRLRIALESLNLTEEQIQEVFHKTFNDDSETETPLELVTPDESIVETPTTY